MPLPPFLLLPLLSLHIPPVLSALQHRPISSFPSDTHASPKFEISFLNGHPVGEEEVGRWLGGLSGGRVGRGSGSESERGKKVKGKGKERVMGGVVAIPLDHSSEDEDRAHHTHQGAYRTWEQLYNTPLHHLSNPASLSYSSLWTDPAERWKFGLEEDTYPRFVKMKLPAQQPAEDDQPRLHYPSFNTSTSSSSPSSAGSQPPLAEYLCLLPSLSLTSPPKEEAGGSTNGEDEAGKNAVQPAVTDALEVFGALGHLEGSCIFHRQGWFTYSYCFNSHIRQFREQIKPGMQLQRIPKEDTEYEAYDLGISPTIIPHRIHLLHEELSLIQTESHTSRQVIEDPEEPGKKIEVVVDVRPAASIEVREMEVVLEKMREFSMAERGGDGVGWGAVEGAVRGQGQGGRGRGQVPLLPPRGKKSPYPNVQPSKEEMLRYSLAIRSDAQSKYLVQRWEAGTVCDMTGRGRVIEVEFRCGGLEKGDEIIGIKETSTCQYIMTINSPKLCSLPGFYIPSPSLGPFHGIQCRRIVPDNDLSRNVGDEQSQNFEDPQSRDRFPAGWDLSLNQPDYERNRQSDESNTEYLDDAEIILPGVDGRPPQRIAKPAKLRKKQGADARNPTNLVRTKRREEARKALEKYKQAKKKAKDAEWAKRLDVRLGRMLGLFDPEDREGLEAMYRGGADEEGEKEEP